MLAGFESATTLGEEVQSATRTIPRVMFFCLLPIGLLFMAGIYSTTALSHSRNIGFDQTNAPLDLIARSIDLPALGWMSSLGVALSCFGCALGGLNAGARVIFSMARERLFAPFFAKNSSRERNSVTRSTCHGIGGPDHPRFACCVRGGYGQRHGLPDANRLLLISSL